MDHRLATAIINILDYVIVAVVAAIVIRYALLRHKARGPGVKSQGGLCPESAGQNRRVPATSNERD